MPKPTLRRMPPKKRPRKAKANTRGSAATETALGELAGEALGARQAIEQAGGVLAGQYRDPLGGKPLLLAVLPLDRVEPTPFQRDVSDAHHKRLADVIDRTGMFLDPIIVITAPKGGFWTPNGGH
ncbi:MAG TPA: chromosome partitioning protein ParB, partial [Opitutaceae bacterium]|nr:chromosome partitioning protein ParB [Opitutaceae bacterium]